MCIADETLSQLFPGTRLKTSTEAEQKMPKVLKTAAREEDKVESSQTKIKEVQRSPSSASLWSAMLLKGRTPKGNERHLSMGRHSGSSFQNSHVLLLEEEHLGKSWNYELSSPPLIIYSAHGGDGELLLTQRKALTPLNLSLVTFFNLASIFSATYLLTILRSQIHTYFLLVIL